MARTIVIGDIHGCYAEFMDLLDRTQASVSDRIICVGDVIVKGSQGREVLDFIRRTGNCESVLGNHENLLLRHFRGLDAKLKKEHFNALAELEGNLADYMAWISRWPLFIDLGTHAVVHAGVRPGRALKDQDAADLMELRTLDSNDRTSRDGTPWFKRYRRKQTVVFGHWVVGAPLLRPNAVGIDTGCVYGGSLTAYVLPEGCVVSVPSRRAYTSKASADQAGKR